VKDNKWMTMAEACLRVGVSRRTLVRMVAAGKLPASHTFYNFRQQYFNKADFLKAWDRGLS
jgi:excisionase family DNA binding protein